MAEQITVHATCVALENKGVLLRGPSGAGKSDLAIRLIETGGLLVSDDQVVLTPEKNRIMASPPTSLAGLLEVRGVGICSYDFLKKCQLAVVIDLKPGCTPERMPDINDQRQSLLGVDIACFQLDPFQASAPAKVRIMLKQLLA